LHLASLRFAALIAECRSFVSRSSDSVISMEGMMQDLLWIAAMGGLLAATLAYVRLCDNA